MSAHNYKRKWGKSPAHMAFPSRVRSARPRDKRKGVRRVSKVKARLDAEYRSLKRGWLLEPENLFCAVGFCQRPTTDLHHSRGRTRKLQNDMRWWVPLCREHHDQVHREPEWARGVVVFRGTEREQPLLCAKGDWRRSK